MRQIRAWPAYLYKLSTDKVFWRLSTFNPLTTPPLKCTYGGLAQWATRFSIMLWPNLQTANRIIKDVYHWEKMLSFLNIFSKSLLGHSSWKGLKQVNPKGFYLFDEFLNVSVLWFYNQNLPARAWEVFLLRGLD